MRYGKWMALVVLALFVLAGPAASQDAKSGNWTFTPKKGGNDILEFLDILIEQTGVSIVYDPMSPQVRGRKIEIKGPVTIPRDEVFSWVRATLFYQRLVLVPVGPRQGNAWALFDINSPQVTTHPEYVPEEDLHLWKDEDGAYIVTTITLKHLTDTARARNALAQLATRQIGRINDVPQTRSFVIAEFAPVAYSMQRLLMEMEAAAKDAPPPPPKPKARKGTPEDGLRMALANYEAKLMGSHTSHAAQYFLTQIRAIQTQLDNLAAK